MEHSNYDFLEELAGSLEGRARLLEPKLVRWAASLKVKDEVRYDAWVAGLRGWPSLGTLKGHVNKLVDRSVAVRTQVEAEKKVEEARSAGRPIIELAKPVEVAKAFQAARRPHLLYVDGQWLDYSINCFLAIEDQEVRAAAQEFMASGVDAETGDDCHPSLRAWTEVFEALKNICFRSNREPEPPTWLKTDGTEPDPKQVIAAKNGLLDVGSGTLMKHSWTYFTRNGLDYDFDPSAPPPLQWLAFLESIWPLGEDGQQNQDALQEVFGYLLTGETKWQKIFLFIGAPNAGKGVIARVIEGLVGSRNVVSQSVTKLGMEFGLKALLGKSVLICPDLRLGRNTVDCH